MDLNFIAELRFKRNPDVPRLMSYIPCPRDAAGGAPGMAFENWWSYRLGSGSNACGGAAAGFGQSATFSFFSKYLILVKHTLWIIEIFASFVSC